MMRYMGGKTRQSRAIVRTLVNDNGTGFMYCEPFAGGMGSAVRVAEYASPSRMILGDVSEPLIRMWDALVNGYIQLPRTVTDEVYQWYKTHQDTMDPLLAWYGHGVSFGGKWFGGLARYERGKQDVYDVSSAVKNTMERVEVLQRVAHLDLVCADYRDTIRGLIGWVIYCDPPYEGRTRAHLHSSRQFNYGEFWESMRKLSVQNRVYITCFRCPSDFTSVYEWGDTVVRHYYGKSGAAVNEKLVVYDG